MPPNRAWAAEREAARSRYLRSAAAPQRGDLTAAAAVAALVVQVLLAPLTLLILVCLMAAGGLSRWRPLWLAAPAAAGLVMVLNDGVRPSLAGYLAAGALVGRHLIGAGPVVPRLAGLPHALAGSVRLLPPQLPGALLAGSGEAWALTLASRRRTSRGDPGRRPRYRPGAVAAARRAYFAASLRRGEVATPNGCCLGICTDTGRRAAISWPEAEHGVLCTGRDPAAVTATALGIVVAAVQHRKAVVIVDLSPPGGRAGQVAPSAGPSGRRGGRAPGGIAAAIDAVCAAVGAPLRLVGGDGGSGWDGRGGDGWSGGDGRSRWGGRRGVESGRGGDGGSGWDGRGGDGWSGGDGGSFWGGRRGVESGRGWDGRTGWGGRGGSCRGRYDPLAALSADEAARLVASATDGFAVPQAGIEQRAGQLRAALARVSADAPPLRGAGPPHGGGPRRRAEPGGSAGSPVSLGHALADRAVVLFGLDRARYGAAAVMVARLALADLAVLLAARADVGVPADCLIWINGCEAIGRPHLAGLIALGPATSATVLLSTAADAAAGQLAADAGVVAIRGLAPPSLRADQAGSAWSEPAAASGGRFAAGPIDQPERAAGGASAGGASAGGASAGGVIGRSTLAGGTGHRDALTVLVRWPRERVLTARAASAARSSTVSAASHGPAGPARTR